MFWDKHAKSKRANDYGNKCQQGLWLVVFFCFVGIILFIVTQASHLFPSGTPALTFHQQALKNFMYGVDFTILESMDNNGDEKKKKMFHNHSFQMECLVQKYQQKSHVTAMLLSVFNDPSNTMKYGSPDEVVRLAKRAKEKKLQILLELHFSDNFTTNSTQTKPAQWKSFTGYFSKKIKNKK
ncbi:arabinogalactan endo-1,4-beta-galactosidase, gal53B [Reticulomyxa filosa]|uniref:arabinogalactan endo-beta-1,4-galactanase n=1 Tax=Reticulomyxa filosa TaxID=46433 RepID=X6MTF2_RETFI|nr:arabinogalactan endo-1,4-beta-galactosidase, gal53B [Reticulomyxa filosa]|eukprot:ETO17134.1 arabinogalactan endo-1,4-beta-galactosidase, gal53B [Reticulomyxa filosa]